MRFPRLYDEAWRAVRKNRTRHTALSDELVWHKVYERYIALVSECHPATLDAIKGLTKAERRDVLVESHLDILRLIAGQIAYRRAPHSFGIWSREASPLHVSLIHELAAFGIFGLFIAADRFEPSHGVFSTYANYWVKKFIRLYLEEIVGIIPRTGHMGEDAPRRSVMDLVDAALDGHRQHRGKASDGMALFDSSLTISGPNRGYKEIEIVGTDGQTSHERLDYLQRRVSDKDFPWIDMGTHFRPRLELKYHAGGKASYKPAEPELTYELEHDPPPVRKATLHRVRDYRLGVETVFIAGEAIRVCRRLKLIRVYRTVYRASPDAKAAIVPAEICYLDRRCGNYNSWDNFGKHTYTPPKRLLVREVPHWHNSGPFAEEWLRRMKARRPVWCKPTYTEEIRDDARHDRENGLSDAA